MLVDRCLRSLRERNSIHRYLNQDGRRIKDRRSRRESGGVVFERINAAVPLEPRPFARAP